MASVPWRAQSRGLSAVAGAVSWAQCRGGHGLVVSVPWQVRSCGLSTVAGKAPWPQHRGGCSLVASVPWLAWSCGLSAMAGTVSWPQRCGGHGLVASVPWRARSRGLSASCLRSVFSHFCSTTLPMTPVLYLSPSSLTVAVFSAVLCVASPLRLLPSPRHNCWTGVKSLETLLFFLMLGKHSLPAFGKSACHNEGDPKRAEKEGDTHKSNRHEVDRCSVETGAKLAPVRVLVVGSQAPGGAEEPLEVGTPRVPMEDVLWPLPRSSTPFC